ncbi:alkaline phosphatase D family protein [Halorussus sp. MSC15.2]|uniref:alkaline phosphatase D family protein n=1 Tax=Halorussus sp. MSC15.2 TaxID=2283638 RepID=UPI0013D44F63|nr:alkaline phosphatase D family protein [Halorussus sp. MSC15.2]NEU58040.1 hypothetical protein [Halorussus sp. MSC15.2]
MTRDGLRSRVTRRGLLVGTASLVGTMAIGGGLLVSGDGRILSDPRIFEESATVTPQPTDGARHWLGPELWGNRLQDWRNDGGRIECLRGESGFELRTVALLTREIVSGDRPAHLRVRAGIADGAGKDGFCGFLVGTGTGNLNPRAGALVQRGSGVGGGLLCTYESDGRVRFRDHTDEGSPVEYRELPAARSTKTDDAEPTSDGSVRLSVDVVPRGDGSFDLRVEAFDGEDGRSLASAVREDVAEETLLGGISLVSSPLPGRDGPRWWFEDIETAGEKVETRPERSFGPIAGTLYSVNDSVMKLSAHLLPMGESDPDEVTLRYRPAGSSESWRTRRATMGKGYVALFRVEDWDATRDWEYQVRYRDGSGETWRYGGRVRKDPADADELTVGLLSCTAPSGRALDSAKARDSDSGAGTPPGRYTPGNVYFPYETLAANLGRQDPDLLVCVGDQVYEPKPTSVAGRDEPTLDYLYKWYLWLWSFRGLTRDRPSILLVDDHDVYQPNVWGSGGEETAMDGLKRGGYVADTEFVNRVQRIQCGHNPDPYDPTPIERGIDVYYGKFTYGGARFAMLEDRKFKTGPEEDGEALLGDRQARFLSEWAEQSDGESVELCLTQTAFANALTDADGELMTPGENAAQSYDTNAYPKAGRDRAIELFREAGALVLSGDLHLPMLLRHGLDAHTDGVVQFVGPGGSANYPRWFEPKRSLPNGREYPHTGNFTDALGNKCRMLAVDNPDISHRQYEKSHDGLLFDREVRPDGYGIVKVKFDEEAFVVECWPWSANPNGGDAEQYRGWPYRLGFGEVNGKQS